MKPQNKPTIKSLIYTFLASGFMSTIALGVELPEEARRLVELRKKAIANIDKSFVADLEKVKITYTKKGDLDSANAILGLINTVQSEHFTRIEGTWKRDYDGMIFEFDSKGGGVFNKHETFRVTYNRERNRFELYRAEWDGTNIIKVVGDGNTLTGSTGTGRSYKLTRVK